MPHDPIEGTKHFARFTLPNGETVDGEFLLDGRQTHVILYPDKPPYDWSERFSTLHAESWAGTVSFLNSASIGPEISGGGGQPQINRVRLYPRFATLGTRRFLPDDRICRLGFVADDFAAIYADFDAFGFDLAPKEHIGDILEKRHARIGPYNRPRVHPGEHPIIAYFTGRSHLLSASTPFGRISAVHRVRRDFGGSPRGVNINNVVMTNLHFDPPATFDRAIEDLRPVLSFLEVIAGRRQKQMHLEIEVDLPKDCPRTILKVYSSSPPDRPAAENEREPHSHDLLLSGGSHPTEFASVLERWLALDHDRADARVQFSDGFSKGNVYDVDRLVSSANMFDILPASAVPDDVELSDELKNAKAEARRIFRALPKSDERASVLGELGRLGKAKLKYKARHRGQIVLAEAGDLRFPDLFLVLNEAVNCRNRYVHGSPAKIDYRNNFFETVAFFTQTLEFVFAASDLIDAGWSFMGWFNKGTTGSHPFGTYCSYYDDNLRVLKTLLDATASETPGSVTE
jgi:ApeA N-terminal domain 1